MAGDTGGVDTSSATTVTAATPTGAAFAASGAGRVAGGVEWRLTAGGIVACMAGVLMFWL